MENFRKDLVKRIKGIIVLNILGLIAIGFGIYYGNLFVMTDDHFLDFIHGAQTGVFVGVQLLAIVMLGKYIGGLRDEKKLRKIYIDEHDERNKFIRDKIGIIGFDLGLVGITIGLIISGFFSRVVFFTLGGVLVFLVLIKACCKIYFYKKY
ncbi:MAG: hypothetical protein ACRCU3_11280 [Eubacteriaceae bacterium]